MKMYCWKCEKDMKKVKDDFHGFVVDAWKCPKCDEIIYDEKSIQPILQYNKLKGVKKALTVTVGALGKSKIFRIPKIAEQLYGINKGEKFQFELESDRITIKMR